MGRGGGGVRKSEATLTDAKTCLRGRGKNRGASKASAPRKGARGVVRVQGAPRQPLYLLISYRICSRLATQSLRKARRDEPRALRGVDWRPPPPRSREDCVLMMMTLLWLVLKYLYYLLSAGRRGWRLHRAGISSKAQAAKGNKQLPVHIKWVPN